MSVGVMKAATPTDITRTDSSSHSGTGYVARGADGDNRYVFLVFAVEGVDNIMEE
jgi:hypothetical protein